MNGIASLICIGLLGGDIITGASAGKVVFDALLLFINSVLWIGGDGMSVLIKDMDKPNACRDCPFMTGGWCRVWSDDETKLTDANLLIEKPDWCPLIEVETVDQEELITPLNMIGGYLRKVTE